MARNRMPRKYAPADRAAGTVHASKPGMGHRTFIDRDGVTWQVWDVHPQLAERRHNARRAPRSMLGPDRRDQRALADRRRRHEVRITVREGYEHGWLAFDSAAESKRLAPIPPDWDTLPDDSLIALCGRSVAASRTRRRLIE